VTASSGSEARPAEESNQRNRGAAKASTAKPRTPEIGTRQRRNAEPEQQRRHWHPVVPGVGAAVPTARRLVGGGRC
jgi:hypothetical protein